MSVIQKSGAPLGSSGAIRDAAPFARDAISGSVYNNGGNAQLSGIKSNYAAKLAQIAQMDQKLNSVYGDPTSKLYIENPAHRLNYTTGAQQTGYKAAGDVAQTYKTTQNDLESKTDAALSLYTKLAAVQARAEKAAKKGSGKNIGKGTIKLTQNEKIAGFEDANAAKYWTSIKETEFKRQWVQSMLEGYSAGGTPIPKGGFTIDDVKANYDSWLKKQPKKKTSVSGGTKGQSLIDKIKSME